MNFIAADGQFLGLLSLAAICVAASDPSAIVVAGDPYAWRRINSKDKKTASPSCVMIPPPPKAINVDLDWYVCTTGDMKSNPTECVEIFHDGEMTVACAF